MLLKKRFSLPLIAAAWPSPFGLGPKGPKTQEHNECSAAVLFRPPLALRLQSKNVLGMSFLGAEVVRCRIEGCSVRKRIVWLEFVRSSFVKEVDLVDGEEEK